MKDYMLLFRGGLDWLNPSPEQLQQATVRWKGWMDKLVKEGNFGQSGIRLSKDGTTIRGKDKRVVDGPYAEGKEIIGGFMTIKARDLHHAIEIAKDCPIFDNGGSAEVREAVG